MRVFIQRPAMHHLDRPGKVPAQEMPHGELGGAEAGEEFQRLHRTLKICLTVQGDVLGQDHADECAVQPRRQLVKSPQRGNVLLRQTCMQALTDAVQPLHHRQAIQTLRCPGHESLAIERRIHRARFISDVRKTRQVEDFLESGGVRHRGFGRNLSGGAEYTIASRSACADASSLRRSPGFNRAAHPSAGYDLPVQASLRALPSSIRTATAAARLYRESRQGRSTARLSLLQSEPVWTAVITLTARTYAPDRHQTPQSLPILKKVDDEQFSATRCDCLLGRLAEC